MIDSIIHIFSAITKFLWSIALWDYILWFLIIGFCVMSVLFKIHFIEKIYLGTLLSAGILLLVNFFSLSLKKETIEKSSFLQIFFWSHETTLFLFCFFAIFIFPYIFLFNHSIIIQTEDEESKVNKIKSFFLWLLYVPYAFSHYFMIIEKQFPFLIKQAFLETLQNNAFLQFVSTKLSQWTIYSAFLSQYFQIFYILGTTYILYRLIIGNIILALVTSILHFIQKKIKKSSDE